MIINKDSFTFVMAFLMFCLLSKDKKSHAVNVGTWLELWCFSSIEILSIHGKCEVITVSGECEVNIK